MKLSILSIICLLFLVSCVTNETKGPPYIKEIPPLAKIPGAGVTFTIPNEDGWKLFDPDGKGSTIVRTGKSNIESYVISLDYYNKPKNLAWNEFKDLYNILKKRETSEPRYNAIKTEEEIDSSRKPYFLTFYYLVEDHQAKHLPKDQKYLLLESMGYFAVDPNNNNKIVRVTYSYRYLPENNDKSFKEKANWVLNNAIFTKI